MHCVFYMLGVGTYIKKGIRQRMPLLASCDSNQSYQQPCECDLPNRKGLLSADISLQW